MEEDTICFPLVLGIPEILLPLELADLVDTGRVLAEAVPFVGVRLLWGVTFFGCARCAFWGFLIAIMHAIMHRVVPGYSRHCVAPNADVSQCVWGRHSFDRCDVLDSMKQKNLFGWGAHLEKTEYGIFDSLGGHASQVKMAGNR